MCVCVRALHAPLVCVRACNAKGRLFPLSYIIYWVIYTYTMYWALCTLRGALRPKPLRVSALDVADGVVLLPMVDGSR